MRPTDATKPRARKRFGQHFLEPAWVAKLIAALDAQPDDVFLEIGPGRGALTIPLAAQVARVIAVEVDRDLAAALPRHLPSSAQVVCADVLETDLAALLAPYPAPVRMVGNLPYNISSPILFSLLRAADDGQRIADATVMLQKEVVDRLTASPGSGDYGTLAVQAAAAANVERLLVLPPGAFRPPPKVWSAVVRLRFRPSPFDRGTPEVFERIVRGIFLQRRKTLRNALGPVAATFGTSAAELLEKTGLDGTLRPQDLPPAAFGRLAGAVL